MFHLRHSRFNFVVSIMILVGLVVGCSPAVYEVDLRPENNSMHRKLRVMGSVEDAESKPQLGREDRERIELFYDDDQVSYDGTWIQFASVFEDQMPGDIGGAGSLTYFDTSLGSMSVYLERFRGQDDLTVTVHDRQQAVDELIELLAGWADATWDQSNPSESDTHERIKTLIDTDLRTDLENMVLYAWTASAAQRDSPPVGEDDDPSSTGAEMTPGFRMIQYLIERDYVSVAEFPKVMRKFSSNDNGDLANMIRQIVIRKTGASRDEFQILGDIDRLTESMRAYLETTKQYETYLAQHQASGSTEDPDAMGVLVGPAFRLWPDFFRSGPSINIALHLTAPPITTNGRWDDEDDLVRWSGSMNDTSMPLMAHAVWVQVDVDTQTQRFGRVIIDQQTLADYVQWYHGLSKDEAGSWDAMMAGLDAATGLETVIETLESFEFEGDPGISDSMIERLTQTLKEPAAP